MISLPLLPEPSELRDAQQRRISYLRVSLTDRCNYRCTYCMPDEGVQLSPKSELLTFEEIERLVRALVPLGVRRVRLTGGEPTLRRDLCELVRRLAALGLDDLSMTTNGQLLAGLARPLREAGLTRLNISVDTLDAPKFRAITRRGDLGEVLDGVEAAHAAGFTGTKINAVVMGGVNDGELADLCRWAWSKELTPRFIEFMPMSDGALFSPGTFVAAAQMREHLERELGAIVPDDGGSLLGVGPARYWRAATGRFAGRRLGLISAVSEPFCETCNRVRLTASGRLHTCLALDDDCDLRGPLRAGATDGELRAIVQAAAFAKKAGHEFTACGAGAPRKHMVAIGG